MPTYEYACRACGREMDIFQSITESPRRKCPECGALKLSRKIGTGAGILFKGSGFYQTDYRSDSYKKGAEAERPKADPPKDEKKTDAVPPKKDSSSKKSDD